MYLRSGDVRSDDFGPIARQHTAPRHLGRPVTGALDLILWNVREHETDDRTIGRRPLVPGLAPHAIGALVHHRRERCAEAVRDVASMITGALEKGVQRVL